MDKKRRLLICENDCVLGKGSEMVSLTLGWIPFHPILEDTLVDLANLCIFQSQYQQNRMTLLSSTSKLLGCPEMVSILLGWVKSQQKLRDTILDPPHCNNNTNKEKPA